LTLKNHAVNGARSDLAAKTVSKKAAAFLHHASEEKATALLLLRAANTPSARTTKDTSRRFRGKNLQI